MKWLRMLFCRHDFKFHRNIYGDEIVYAGWKRSDWKCSKCGRLQLRRDLHRPTPPEAPGHGE